MPKNWENFGFFFPKVKLTFFIFFMWKRNLPSFFNQKIKGKNKTRVIGSSNNQKMLG
jgi:hypothetical protein